MTWFREEAGSLVPWKPCPTCADCGREMPQEVWDAHFAPADGVYGEVLWRCGCNGRRPSVALIAPGVRIVTDA